MKRICVLTSGHLASTPRMLKAADALHEAGYQVRMVCAEHVDWAIEAGEQSRAMRSWRCDVVDWNPKSARRLYWKSRIRHKLSKYLLSLLGADRLSLGLVNRALCRVSSELLHAVTREPCDLIYGGTSGGLAIAALAAKQLGVPFALDLEDYHSEQQEGPEASWMHSGIERIEQQVLRQAAFLTAGSNGIATAYASKYGVRPITINNVFPLPSRIPPFDRPEGVSLRLYWFSQFIGHGRGLEDAIQASGRLGRPVWLGLIGSNRAEYTNKLTELAKRVSPGLRMEFLGHRSPDEMVEAARQADVGLALEIGVPRNRRLCVTNKIFTYMLAGLAVAATDTEGQRPIVEDLGEGGFCYPPGDIGALAGGLKRWAENPQALLRAKMASWEAAGRRWHWEHPLERGALLDAVGHVFSRTGGYASPSHCRS